MEKGKSKGPRFFSCLLSGMLGGTVLGAAMGKLAVGIALGNMLGIMYYLLSGPKSENPGEDNEEKIS